MRLFVRRRLLTFSARGRSVVVARQSIVTLLTLAIIAPSVVSVQPLHAQATHAHTTRVQSLPARAVVARVADSLAKAFLAAHNAPSVAVAVVRGSDTLVMRAWGKADLEQEDRKAHV